MKSHDGIKSSTEEKNSEKKLLTNFVNDLCNETLNIKLQRIV